MEASVFAWEEVKKQSVSFYSKTVCGDTHSCVCMLPSENKTDGMVSVTSLPSLFFLFHVLTPRHMSSCFGFSVELAGQR